IVLVNHSHPPSLNCSSSSQGLVLLSTPCLLTNLSSVFQGPLPHPVLHILITIIVLIILYHILLTVLFFILLTILFDILLTLIFHILLTSHIHFLLAILFVSRPLV
ncbi:MAG: hypothetical protein ACK55Z_03485, partial [bacterium]